MVVPGNPVRRGVDGVRLPGNGTDRNGGRIVIVGLNIVQVRRPSLVIDKKLAVSDELFFVAVIDDKVIGTVMAGYDGHRGWIYSVAVSPSHRREGIGSQLVSHAERALIAKGAPTDPY